MRNYLILVAAACSLLWQTAITAAEKRYNLKPVQVAESTWIIQGAREDFTAKNGGNIVNTAFVVTGQGVVVIDSGPSLRYGEEMRAAIKGVTDQPVALVFNTHHHPDHFLGNQAFQDVDILALPDTGKQIAQHGNAFAENMYRMVGDWMRSTEVYLPSKPVDTDRLSLGRHNFRLLAFRGHTGADLVVLDETTGVLFASDIVFYQRALTTPHTPGIDVWLEEIEKLRALDYKVMIPGHGPVVKDDSALNQMAAYLKWLDQTLQAGAEQGKSMIEVIKTPIPEAFSSVALSRREFARTVAHLYAGYEEKVF